MKVTLLTLGCKVNQSEVASIEAGLIQSGARIVGLDENPDFCVINTCSVTSKSDYQSRQLIRRAVKTGAKIIVTGCYSELNAMEIKGMKDVIRVVPNSDKSSIIKLIANDSSSSLSIAAVRGPGHGRSRYFLKIQDGCSYSCSYCIVWKARGASRSIDPEAVIEQVRQAAEYGYKEVVLTGIHLGLFFYQVHSGKTMGLSALVEKILSKTSVRRLRLSSLEVNEVDDRLIELMKSGRLCRHLHMPLQSGDDYVLSLMKRRYKSGVFTDKVNKLVSEIPEIAVGTDLIVGFPGEGDREFGNTISLLERLPLAYMHVFPYSERPGTEAAGLPGKVDGVLKKRRAQAARELAEDKKRRFADSLINKEFNVIIEEDPKEFLGQAGCTGITDNYVKVFIPAENTGLPNDYPAGSVLDISIRGLKQGIAVGKPVIKP
ncbi:MAG: tRNA (N(6)-L-threonylcarbamoyladenosine(37)-C(2))-methylthiotransferase MtaB [Nitrospiraceae bacterium]|nr:tRNA (N(6)-L-threonylcarbamoyladenosine(37)-C(2))-methylthiotransferase MtaB [Nitrospiraceae bacterium]